MSDKQERPSPATFNSTATVCDEDLVESPNTVVAEDSEKNAIPTSDESKLDPLSDPSLPPLDGKRGWMVVIGAFAIQILAFGVASSWDLYGFIFKHILSLLEPWVELTV
ncbi:hypothetical protein DM01DRAFT_1026766 [Hesseltinella vesiculosa]|uniref:Uncharacterized protein n=1 Tax=Hesseltinella vesiculosa TaxID=101127 RepID=A0A1X2GKI7_9FUNG|nr:hypothetical protein DM01DRAFT_1026766 [Hesseltinella vesiculosa]